MTREELLTELLTDHWTQLMATGQYAHSVSQQHDGAFSECPRRVCVRVHEVAAKADALLGLEAKAAVVRAQMDRSLHHFAAEFLVDE